MEKNRRPPTSTNVPVTKARSRVFPPAGRCVYCGDRNPPLTKEHILPLGLGGGLILPKASCKTCQIVTRDIETYCLRGPLLPHRLHAGLVQHPQQLGTTRSLRFKIGDKEEVRRIPLEHFPHYLALPFIHRGPGLVAGGSPGEFFQVSFRFWGDEAELRALHQTGNALLVDNFDMLRFARMLAKIAHAQAAAEIGLEHFDAVLPNLILGHSPDLASYLVGGCDEADVPTPASPPLHRLNLMMEPWGKRWLASIRIQLFAAQINSPAYRIVVGELIDSPALLERFGLWSL